MSARASRVVLAAALAGCALLTLNGCFAAPAGPDGKAIAAEIEEEVAEFFVEADEARQVRAVLVYHDGEPIIERYTEAGPDDYWDTRSVTKSVVSTLVGIAIEQGLIPGVDATLGELLPSHAAEMTKDVAAITLEQLLTQTENFPEYLSPEATFWESPDWVTTILAQRSAAGPGDGSFRYSDAGPHLLSAILTQATGRSILDFAREYLFEPLGIPTEPATEIVLDLGGSADRTALLEAFNNADFAWPVDPQGFNVGGALLKLRPQDLGALGLAYLAGGRSPNGEQVIPETWVAAATANHVDQFGYGYLWWTVAADGAPAFAAFGRGGQLIEVVPDRELVVVVATEFDELDPDHDLKSIDSNELTALVSSWIAPHFAPD